MEKKNCRLAPSLLAADFYRLGEQVQALEEGGCQLTGGNIAVIVIVLVAAFLLWFVDMRRR